MNEQIEHCLYQAGLTAQGCWDELDDYAKQAIEKFAELIILECASVASMNSLENQGLYTIIYEHFGFEL